ncbi:hypothetical protein L195_g043795, partial [Trifolium pratense]
MPTSSRSINISVTWRGKKFVVDMNLDATVKDLGEELQKLTNIKQDTMKLIVPQIAGKTSKLLAPFSTEHALLSLQETSITELVNPLGVGLVVLACVLGVCFSQGLSNQVGMGACIRDEKGQFVAAATRYMDAKMNP